MEKQKEFIDERAVEKAPDALEIARAVGEGLAAQIGGIRKVDTTSAAIVAMQIEQKSKKVRDDQARYAQKLRSEEHLFVEVSVPTIYKQYRPSFTLSRNGVTVKIPADGRTYKIHPTFATMLTQRLKRLDEKIEYTKRNENHIQYVKEM